MVFVKFMNSLGLATKGVEHSGTSFSSAATAAEEENSMCTDLVAPKGLAQDGSTSAESTLASEEEYDDAIYARDVASSDSESSEVESIESNRTYSRNFLLRAHPVTGSCVDRRLLYSTRPVMESEEPWQQRLANSAATKIGVNSKAPLATFTASAGSWIAQQRKGALPNSDKDAAVGRAACSILNKLTIEKFEPLFEQLASCGISKPEHLQMLMREVFHKATTQHHFIPMYADLCVRLEQDPRIEAVEEAAGHQHGFRRLLLNQCQIAFEQLLETSAEAPETDEEERIRRKQQAIGNMKLIGHLLVHGIVTSKLLVECSEEVLRCHKTCPDALESLTALLMVAGKTFDNERYQFHDRLLAIFATLKSLSKDKSTPSRARFLLRDTLDAREAGWLHCTYKAATTAPPMRLDEVRESAAREVKYMSVEEHVQTDSLLAGLLQISETARNRKDQEKVNSRISSKRIPPQRKKRAAKKVPVATIVDEQSEATPTRHERGSQPSSPASFDVVAFRRSLSATLADLASDRNIAAAARSIRSQGVPVDFQAQEFADILTRIVEERRGPVRRCCLAFAAGLAATEKSTFNRQACLDGLAQFFEDVYPELSTEIPRLPAIITSELAPTMQNVFSKSDIDKILPTDIASK